jgi:hypothetical protein
MRAEWTWEQSHLQDQCQKRHLHIISHDNVGALFGSIAITHLGLIGAHHGKVEGLLSILTAFKVKYSEHFVSIIGESVYRAAARIARERGDFGEARRYEEELRVAITNCAHEEVATDSSWRFTKAARSDPSSFIRESRFGRDA